MTEPTAEQVAEQHGAAMALLRDVFLWSACDLKSGHGLIAIDAIATALARIRIEAHAAGRDEGLDAAADIAEGYGGDEIAYDIRALRGRT